MSDFRLVNPENPSDKIVVHNFKKAGLRNLEQQTSIHKSKAKSFWQITKFIEKLDYIAYEGSSLTFLGILKYDVKLASFTLSNVSLIASGGAKECLDYMKEHIKDLRVSIALNNIGLALAAILGI